MMYAGTSQDMYKLCLVINNLRGNFIITLTYQSLKYFPLYVFTISEFPSVKCSLRFLNDGRTMN